MNTKVKKTTSSRNSGKPDVSSSADLRRLRKLLKLAKVKLENAEYELDYADHMVTKFEDEVNLIQRQIKDLKDSSIAN